MAKPRLKFCTCAWATSPLHASEGARKANSLVLANILRAAESLLSSEFFFPPHLQQSGLSLEF